MSTFTLKQISGGSSLTPALYNQNTLQTQTAIRALQDASTSSGTVTSVGLVAPNIFSVTNSPITSSGSITFSLVSQTANRIFASPNGSNGVPSFRSIVLADLPTITPAKGGNGLTALGTAYQMLRINSGASANEYISLTSANNKFTLTPSAGVLTFSIVESELDMSNMKGITAILNGGTGATTAQNAIKNLTQASSGTVGHYYTLDSGKNPVWTAFPSITTAKLTNNAVTYAKIQSVGAFKLIGNGTNATANANEIEVLGNLAFSSGTLVDRLSKVTTVVNNTTPSDRTYGTTYLDTASGEYTHLLPSAGDCSVGDIFVYTRIGASNNATIQVQDVLDDVINGGTTTTTYVLARNYDCVWLQYVGVVSSRNTWRIINKIINGG